MTKKDLKNTDFDFEYWAKLAETDALAFEQARSEAIREFIEAAPKRTQRRLIGLQWQIDTVRDRAASPLQACMKISQMMWDQVLGKNGLVDAIGQIQSAAEGRLPPKIRARVIPFADTSGQTGADTPANEPGRPPPDPDD